MAKSVKGVTVARFTVDPTLPETAQALSLGTAVLRAAKAMTWSDLNGEIPWTIDLTDAQMEMLDKHTLALSVLRNGMPKSGAKSTFVVTCGVCKRWMLVAATAPNACPMKYGCTGHPVKVSAAAKRDIPLDPITGEAVEPQPQPETEISAADDPILGDIEIIENHTVDGRTVEAADIWAQSINDLIPGPTTAPKAVSSKTAPPKAAASQAAAPKAATPRTSGQPAQQPDRRTDAEPDFADEGTDYDADGDFD